MNKKKLKDYSNNIQEHDNRKITSSSGHIDSQIKCKNGMFKCPQWQCQYIVRAKSGLLKHIQSKHEEVKFDSKIFKKHFAHRKGLVQNIQYTINAWRCQVQV